MKYIILTNYDTGARIFLRADLISSVCEKTDIVRPLCQVTIGDNVELSIAAYKVSETLDEIIEMLMLDTKNKSL